MRNSSKDVQLRLLYTATVLEDEVRVIGLDRKGGDHALIRLAEIIYAHIKVEGIVFNDRRIHLGSQVVEFDLRRTLQIGQDLQAGQWTILFPGVVRIADPTHVCNA